MNTTLFSPQRSKMAGLKAVLNRRSKGNFIVRNAQQQDFALLDENFIAKFSYELKTFWHVVDWDLNQRYLQAEIEEKPYKLTAGWVVMREKYNMVDGDFFMFRYLGLYRGNNVFQVTKFSSNRTTHRPALRRPITEQLIEQGIDPNSRIAWEITLTNYDVTGSQLTLGQQIAHRIRKMKIQEVQLFMTPGRITTCKLLNMNKSNRSLKIGEGWKKFCQQHKLKEGNTVEFTFMSTVSNMIQVVEIVD